MPRGEPTKTVRLPVWLLDKLADEAGGIEGVPALITRRLGAPRAVLPSEREFCSCSNPTLSKHVTNLCTVCGRLRG